MPTADFDQSAAADRYLALRAALKNLGALKTSHPADAARVRASLREAADDLRAALRMSKGRRFDHAGFRLHLDKTGTVHANPTRPAALASGLGRGGDE